MCFFFSVYYMNLFTAIAVVLVQILLWKCFLLQNKLFTEFIYEQEHKTLLGWHASILWGVSRLFVASVIFHLEANELSAVF